MSRILFVHPFQLSASALEQEWRTLYPPLGLLYLAAIVRRAGHTVSFYDGTFKQAEHAEFDLELTNFNADVICIGSLITVRPDAIELAAHAHKSGITTILGGPDPTLAPEEYLNSGVVDWVIRGEGERSLLQLQDVIPSGEEYSDIPGIAYIDSTGQLIITSDPQVVPELDDLPYPARDLIDMQAYADIWRSEHGYISVNLSASRGCALGCSYCAESNPGAHFRIRSAKSVAAEMFSIQESYAPDRFRLVDDLDGLGAEWLTELAGEMEAAAVTVPFEGLRLHQSLGELPQLERTKELCADRNSWIPKSESHPHAPPGLDIATLQARWRRAHLEPGETLAEP